MLSHRNSLLFPTALFVLLFVGEIVKGQDATVFNKISIASPNAASLGKYGDVPVNYHTGIPQIGIPIYTVKEGSLQLPISVTYHAGGLKVMETASSVGMGWSLNAGGVITRTVIGAPDDRGFNSETLVSKGHFTDYGFNNYLFINGRPQGNGPPLVADTFAADDQHFILGEKDGEPDLFFFNFGGYSGKFYFRDDRTPVIVPEADVKIEPYFPSGSYYIKGFIITTPDGVKYYFGKNQSGDGNVDAVESTDTYTSDEGLTNAQAITSWYLNKIVSADNQFSIKLIYQQEQYSYYTISMFPVPSSAVSPDDKGVKLVKNFVNGVRLSKVSFSNGTVNFLTGSTRLDLGAGENVYNAMADTVNSESKTLGSIQITDSASYCKKFIFSYSYFTDNTTSLPGDINSEAAVTTDKKRLRLDSIQEKTCDSSKTIPPYKFTYTTPSNDSVFAPRRLTFAQDHWGFYNGQTGNTKLIPAYTTNTFTEHIGANRESSWPSMSYGTLAKIIYPTGGNTQFEFESNDVWLNYTYYNPTSRATSGVGPGIGQSSNQTIPITTTSNPYKIVLNFHTNPGSGTSGSASISTITVDRLNPHAEVVLQPGAGNQTYYLSMANMSSGTNDWADCIIYEEVPTNYQDNAVIGGLRIKKIFHNDGVTNTPDTTFYSYRSGTQSTGILYSRPTYVQTYRNDLVALVGYSNPGSMACSPNGCLTCDIAQHSYFKSPGSLRPMQTTQGNHIGYNEVKVSQTGNGYTDYRYYGSDVWDNILTDVSIRDADLTTCSTTIPNYPAAPLAFEYKRGELKYEAHYKEGGQLINETYYYLVFVNDTISTPAYLVNLLAGTLYELTSARKTKMTVLTRYHANGALLTTIDSTFFESRFHHMATRKVTVNSTGDRIETKYKYANDFRVANCDSISTGYSTYTSAVSTATSTFGTQLYTCTDNSWSCKWVAYQQYRYDLSKARIAFISRMRSNFTDSANVFKTNHNTAKSGADSELQPVLELQDKYQNPVIETTSWKKSQLAGAVYGKYAITDSNVYLSQAKTIQLAALSSTFTNAVSTTTSVTKDSRYKDETSYSFDAGNLSKITAHDGVSESYVWDYLKNQPIAKVINAGSEKIAYTSFEADGKGNWTFSGNPVIDYSCPTGKKVYVLNGSNNITKSSLNSSTTYILTYWTKNSSAFSITGTISGFPIAGRTADGWKFYEHRLTGQTSITISGTGSIDELRLYPVTAQMMTYCYVPLVGVTSQCDVNNRIAYYEYDKLGRLIVVKDQDRKVVKKICYNYAGQAEDCSSGYFVNSLQTGSYTKNDCGTGYTGTTVIDSVLAGAYSSPISQGYADTLAMNEVIANGQANANAKGSCNCDTATCAGPSQKCIYNSCMMGDLKCVSSVFNSKTHLWTCTYNYVFSMDCSSNFAYTTTSATSCTVDPPCH